MDHKITYAIAANDNRYRGVNDDGTIRIHDEDKGILNLTPDEFVEYGNVSTAEEFFVTLDLALSDLTNVNLANASDMVNLLLDLRVIFANYHDEENAIKKVLMDMALGRHDEPVTV